MGCLSVIVGIVGSLLLWKTNHTVLMVIEIVFAAACLWSWGIMHNYATESAKQRPNYSGGFYDILADEANSVPNWITNINILVSLGSIALLITAVIMLVF